MTAEEDRRLLLQLARDAVAAHVGAAALPSPPSDGVCARRGGAFVTLHSRGDLRGCIGHVEATDPLGHVIVRCAIAACSTDPRFPPVTAAELPHLDFELSLLGPLEPVTAIEEIEVGRHGLVVEMHWRRGLLLPQVATEWRWDRETFVVQTCVKAGLPRDAWKNGATLKRFDAEVFGDR
ncbi:MAG: AmmeMemoRadiSam system protein A [Acidobacteriia bacterium]|nr:AmmeMemoRadiSam system protein A [Terriglobia bacterium]